MDFLANKKNYYPLESKIARWLNPRPLYVKSSEIGLIVPPYHYVIRILGSIIFMYIGYKMGMYEAEVENKYV